MPAPPRAGLTRMPVASAPTMPPMQWMPKASRLSSYLSAFFTTVQKKKQIGADDEAEDDRAHRAGEAGGRGDGHEAGDDARGHAEQRRLALGSHSVSIQERPAAAVATKVLIIARARVAVGFQVGAGVEAEPADPQQPGADQGQVSECGGIGSLR